MRYINILLTFLKVGIIGFGGGSALIPVIENELVTRQKAMESGDYIKHTVVANITPGALPVKLGATCGYSLFGVSASVGAAYCVMLPGTLFTVLIIALFSMMGQQAVNYLTYASVGITVFIVFLLINYTIKTVKDGSVRRNVIICAAALFLTFGKVIREIIEYAFSLPAHALGTPVFNISMINLMILSFYLIIFTQLTKKKSYVIAAFVLSGVYALFCGKSAASWPVAGIARLVVIALFVLSILSVWLTGPRSGDKGKFRPSIQKGILLSIALFIGIPVVIIIVMLILGIIPGGSVGFLGNVVVSAVTSFGGGEAYVAIADSIFVQSGYVAGDIFYNRIVPVANALPGPILIKVVAAIGFVFGQTASGMTGGICLAAVTALTAVGACSAIAMLVLNFYDALKDSVIVRSLKKYILSVICGSLISVSLAMFYEAIKVAGDRGFNPLPTFGVMAVCVAFTSWLHKRYRVHDLILLGVSIVVSLGVFMLFGQV